jgi:transcriptional regulator with XRE-family HTH domain
MSLHDAIAGFQAGNPGITENTVATAFYSSPRVGRLIRHACFERRLDSDWVDEVRQELAVLLLRKYVSTIDNPEKIYNVLHVAACNIARRSVENNAKVLSLDALSSDDETKDLLYFDHNARTMDQVNESLDNAKAVEEFNRRFARQTELAKKARLPTKGVAALKGNIPVELSQPTLRMPMFDTSVTEVRPRAVRADTLSKRAAPVQAANGKRAQSAEAVELSEIRVFLGYSVPELADALGISKGTLSSYIYGTVQTIPPTVMDNARLMKEQGTVEYQKVMAKFGALSMTKIVDLWTRKLGGFTDSRTAETELAKAAGVDRATVWRWRNRDMRPSWRNLKTYDEAIEKYARRLADPQQG